MQPEWTRYYRQPAFCDLEALHARFINHRFSRHAHDYFVIGYVELGVQAYTYRGAEHKTPAGHIFFVNPGEIHDGEAAYPNGYIYRTLYPRVSLMEQVVEYVTGRRRVPFFNDAVILDQRASDLLLLLHNSLAESAPALKIESLLICALSHLVTHHADIRSPRQLFTGKWKSVRQAQEYLEAYYEQDVSLSDLAALVGVSPFHLARAFQRQVGLPPHAYLESVRIRKGRELLDKGMPIAEVSLAVGYSDQSHFTKRFRSFTGITPGLYARAVPANESSRPVKL